MRCSRREFFTKFGQSVAADVSASLRAMRGAIGSRVAMDEPAVGRPTAQQWIRPPGALSEERFLSACTRCTDCQTACPYDAIRRLGPDFGDVSGTPAIIPAETPCYLCKDMPCISACEPKALLPLERNDVAMGTAVIDEADCYQAHGQPCDYCVVRCPIGSSAIAFDERRIPTVNDASCTGCGICAYLCPPSAIRIEPFRNKK